MVSFDVIHTRIHNRNTHVYSESRAGLKLMNGVCSNHNTDMYIISDTQQWRLITILLEA